jgi:Carbohydrate family 9 binding domain-like
MQKAAALFLTLCLSGCRDEQAGPRARAPAAAAGQGANAQRAPLSFTSGATFGGGALRYVGARVVPLSPEAGAPLRVTHVFLPLKPLPEGFQLFVHLVDPRTGQMLANDDHPLAAPLESWPVGKAFEDTQDIVLPPGVASARLLLGFWRGDERLPVDQPQAQDGQNRMAGPLLESLAATLPEYRVVRAKLAPLIDGILDDVAWKRATPVNLVNSLDGSPGRVRTTARLLWDDKYLYVSFDCEDPDVWTTFTKRDEPLYTQEAVEIFIDADGDGRTYNEIEVNAANALFDAYFPERRQGMDLSWDSGALTAVTVQGTLNDASDKDEGWRVEMRIPFDRLAAVPHLPPRPGDRWRFNLYRIEHHNRREVEGQAFSPPRVGDFHALNRFAWLVFED